MMLRLMLYGLAVMLRRNAHKPEVERMLRGRRCSVQIRTRDGCVSRHFVFCGSAVFSRRGVLHGPDVDLTWKDASTAATVLRSGDPASLQEALAREWLLIEGSSDLATWFGDLVRAARGDASEPSATADAVAVIGLGRMGSGIAHRLLAAGHPLVVYNRTIEKAQPLLAAGARVASTPAEAAAAAKRVVTSLMGDASIIEVLEGPSGILSGLGRGCIHIGASTISAQATRRVAQRHKDHGSHYLAAPVIGRPEAARAGDLIALVCGERAAFEASRPVLQAFTRMVQYLGEDHVLASAAKLAVNYTGATLIDLMGQVYAFGEKAGIPGATIHAMFRMMWAPPPLQGYATRIWRRDFEDLGFDLLGGLKDVTLMIEAAKDIGVRWEFAEIIQRKMKRGIEMGLAGKDWSSTYEVTRAESGLGG